MMAIMDSVGRQAVAKVDVLQKFASLEIVVGRDSLSMWTTGLSDLREFAQSILAQVDALDPALADVNVMVLAKAKGDA